MGTEMIVVNGNWSMPECVKRMREQAEDMDEIFYVYVVDDDRKLKGILPLKTLITNPSASKIKHVMEPDPYSVKADEPLDDVCSRLRNTTWRLCRLSTASDVLWDASPSTT